MKNPVNRLATAAPRAFDSLLGAKQNPEDKQSKKNSIRKERTCSFDLDLSGLKLDSSSSVTGSSTVGLSASSIAEDQGSVVTFEEFSEFTEISLDWRTSMDVDTSTSTGGTPSPN